MDIIHSFGKFNSINQTARSDASLMLAGGGSYLWIGKNPSSRYQGWFFETGAGLVKIIDDIRIKDEDRFLAFKNDFWRAQRVWKNNIQTFSILAVDCLACEFDKPSRIEFFLDIKEPYRNPESGRHHRVWQENQLLLASYRQDADFRLPEIFLAVCGNFDNLKIKNEWIRRDYEFDERRASPPFYRWVFSPAEFFASKLIFAVGFDRVKTAARAKNVWRDYQTIKEQKKKSIAAPSIFFSPVFAGKKDRENLMAKDCAKSSLKSLLFELGGRPALRAGLPWFFQTWQRDEAVSIKGLALFDAPAAAGIFWRQIDELKNNHWRFGTADGVGLIFSRAADLPAAKQFNSKEIKAVGECLQNSIDYLLKNNTQNDLAANYNSEKTWMDSLNRSGAAIEIQALRIKMYSLAAGLAVGEKEKEYYENLANKLKSAVRQNFFDKNRLADKFDVGDNSADFTCRPNIFLAAYICPDLFSKYEWIKIFDWALPRLWCDWGGLSTIDKNDPRFCARDTGEDSKSYHNGDSWFWINNIAAIAMARADRKKFKNHIEKIFEASKNDILWNGAIGCAGEISSAAMYESAGCPNQAWSAATFLELYHYLSGKF